MYKRPGRPQRLSRFLSQQPVLHAVGPAVEAAQVIEVFIAAVHQLGRGQGGTAAGKVSLRFSPYKTAVFDYDAASGKYLVSQFGEAYIDGNTGKQVGVTNVLTLKTRIRLISGDTAGRMTADLTSGGEGMYFCGGQGIPIRWEKASRNDPFVYRTEDGQLLELGRGVSYCATCDAPFYRDKTVAVVGYSEHSREEASFLAETAKEVLYFPAAPHGAQAGPKVRILEDKPAAML